MSGAAEPRAGERSRREILDAAAKFLRSHGYRATTLRDIASAVGIKAGSIYYHFPSKDAIVAAVMNDGVDRVHDAVTAALAALPKGASIDQRIEAAIRAHLHALLEFSDYTSAGLKAYADVPEAVRREARPHRQRYEAIWSMLVEEMARAGRLAPGISPETMRMALLGVMNWSPEWYRPGRHSIDCLAGEFTSLVLGASPGKTRAEREGAS